MLKLFYYIIVTISIWVLFGVRDFLMDWHSRFVAYYITDNHLAKHYGKIVGEAGVKK